MAHLKRGFLPLVFALALCCAGTAAAQQAANLTPRCSFVSPDPTKAASVLSDQAYLTYLTLPQDSALDITLPEGARCAGLYCKFSGLPAPCDVMGQTSDGGWAVLARVDISFVNNYIALPPTAGALRLQAHGETRISELRVLGEGDLPAWVQTWRTFEGKADLMLVVAHPDDEYVFLGGTLPYYCGQLHKKTLVVYMTTGYTRRRNELLDGLWASGVRDYPVLCEYRDGYTHLITYAFNLWGGRDAVYRRVTNLVRLYQPDVVVTMDIKNGEDKHGMHRAAADAAVNAVALAADPAYTPDGAGNPDVWQVRKLYVHLYPKNRVILPWDTLTLSVFGGKTAADVAREAFHMHVSQRKTRHKVYLCNPYDSKDFGLYSSTVGPDEQRNDFFEHIPAQPQ